jgi:hypothetical protein
LNAFSVSGRSRVSVRTRAESVTCSVMRGRLVVGAGP